MTLEGWKQVCPDFLVRTLRARCGQTTRTIRQFHYTTWPDHGVPAIISPIIELVRLVRDCQPSEALPVLVHCSAGCGRTGTFCAIDYVHGLVRYGKLNSNLSLFKIIQEMRQQRVAMVSVRYFLLWLIYLYVNNVERCSTSVACMAFFIELYKVEGFCLLIFVLEQRSVDKSVDRMSKKIPISLLIMMNTTDNSLDCSFSKSINLRYVILLNYLLYFIISP